MLTSQRISLHFGQAYMRAIKLQSGKGLLQAAELPHAFHRRRLPQGVSIVKSKAFEATPPDWPYWNKSPLLCRITIAFPCYAPCFSHRVRVHQRPTHCPTAMESEIYTPYMQQTLTLLRLSVADLPCDRTESTKSALYGTLGHYTTLYCEQLYRVEALN